MRNKEYSTAVGRSTKKNRLGCSVCPKKIDSENVNLSSNNVWFERKREKQNECEKGKITTAFSSRAKVNECYCEQMKQIKTSSPKLICSKYLKMPNLTQVDKDWLIEIMEFRRENWFDCHSDLFNDKFSIKNINSGYLLNEHILNYYHLNDPISENINMDTEFNELKIQNKHKKYLESPTVRVKLEIVKKKTTKQKSIDKKKSIPNTPCKPWIPS